jgi:hypothetical protein
MSSAAAESGASLASTVDWSCWPRDSASLKFLRVGASCALAVDLTPAAVPFSIRIWLL